MDSGELPKGQIFQHLQDALKWEDAYRKLWAVSCFTAYYGTQTSRTAVLLPVYTEGESEGLDIKRKNILAKLNDVLNLVGMEQFLNVNHAANKDIHFRFTVRSNNTKVDFVINVGDEVFKSLRQFKRKIAECHSPRRGRSRSPRRSRSCSRSPRRSRSCSRSPRRGCSRSPTRELDQVQQDYGQVVHNIEATNVHKLQLEAEIQSLANAVVIVDGVVTMGVDDITAHFANSGQKVQELEEVELKLAELNDERASLVAKAEKLKMQTGAHGAAYAGYEEQLNTMRTELEAQREATRVALEALAAARALYRQRVESIRTQNENGFPKWIPCFYLRSEGDCSVCFGGVSPHMPGAACGCPLMNGENQMIIHVGCLQVPDYSHQWYTNGDKPYCPANLTVNACSGISDVETSQVVNRNPRAFSEALRRLLKFLEHLRVQLDGKSLVCADSSSDQFNDNFSDNAAVCEFVNGYSSLDIDGQKSILQETDETIVAITKLLEDLSKNGQAVTERLLRDHERKLEAQRITHIQQIRQLFDRNGSAAHDRIEDVIRLSLICGHEGCGQQLSSTRNDQCCLQFCPKCDGTVCICCKGAYDSTQLHYSHIFLCDSNPPIGDLFNFASATNANDELVTVVVPKETPDNHTIFQHAVNGSLQTAAGRGQRLRNTVNVLQIRAPLPTLDANSLPLRFVSNHYPRELYFLWYQPSSRDYVYMDIVMTPCPHTEGPTTRVYEVAWRWLEGRQLLPYIVSAVLTLLEFGFPPTVVADALRNVNNDRQQARLSRILPVNLQLCPQYASLQVDQVAIQPALVQFVISNPDPATQFVDRLCALQPQTKQELKLEPGQKAPASLHQAIRDLAPSLLYPSLCENDRPTFRDVGWFLYAIMAVLVSTESRDIQTRRALTQLKCFLEHKCSHCGLPHQTFLLSMINALRRTNNRYNVYFPGDYTAARQSDPQMLMVCLRLLARMTYDPGSIDTEYRVNVTLNEFGALPTDEKQAIVDGVAGTSSTDLVRRADEIVALVNTDNPGLKNALIDIIDVKISLP
jgi:hypothetical protein